MMSLSMMDGMAMIDGEVDIKKNVAVLPVLPTFEQQGFWWIHGE